jgi:pimeloyl-ACP methyl ester carboxylesterase
MGSVLLTIILLPVILAAAAVAVTFLLAWLVFPGGGSRGPNDTLASRIVGIILAVIMEWLATVWVIMVIPARAWRPRQSRRRLSPDRVPVALLPGMCENALTMSILARWLERTLGVPVRVLRPVRYFTGVEVLALDYRRQVEAWLEELGAERADLVGHSLGGLLARHLVERGGFSAKIRVVVTIATPHLGSALAALGPYRIMRQMRRGSAYLESLNSGPTSTEARIVGISSTHDNLVLPWNCALSPRGDNFIIRYRGHMSLIFSREVLRIIVRELRE